VKQTRLSLMLQVVGGCAVLFFFASQNSSEPPYSGYVILTCIVCAIAWFGGVRNYDKDDDKWNKGV